MRESETPTYMNGPETEKEYELKMTFRLRIRSGAWGSCGREVIRIRSYMLSN